MGDDYPYQLGHEASGVVAAVGGGVTEVAVGDKVILNWRAVCGECRACRKGEPWYCFATHNATQKMTLEDGAPLSPALGIGAFAGKTLVAAGQCTKIEGELEEHHHAAGARDMYFDLLSQRLRALGPGHPDTLTTRNNLAHWTGGAENRSAD